MERVSQDTPLDKLCRANERLTLFLNQFSAASVSGTDQEVECLLQVEQILQSVGMLLSEGVQDSEDPNLQQELRRYRDNLISVLRELSRMQKSAMACRARVCSSQQHLSAVKAWCITSRGTH